MRLSEKNRLSLVLSGGGVKAAAFHAGVCLGLQERGFSFAGGDKKTVDDNFPESSMTFKSYVGSKCWLHHLLTFSGWIQCPFHHSCSHTRLWYRGFIPLQGQGRGDISKTHLVIKTSSL